MRAGEGDESIKELADEAEETQSTLDDRPDPDDEAVDDANALGEATPRPR
jgi:hypothetical protein